MDVTGLGFSQRHTHTPLHRAMRRGREDRDCAHHCAIRGMSTALANIYDIPCAALRLRHGEEHGLHAPASRSRRPSRTERLISPTYSVPQTTRTPVRGTLYSVLGRWVRTRKIAQNDHLCPFSSRHTGHKHTGPRTLREGPTHEPASRARLPP